MFKQTNKQRKSARSGQYSGMLTDSEVIKGASAEITGASPGFHEKISQKLEPGRLSGVEGNNGNFF
ncbi:hypothetical protein [Dawidia soli]|uniref:Uncharacterized protein n=1 Tax=Dawidia soli TaxID=2782352 RepID=A0AAP2GE35_9BACT|nr:hypothetical protein [Dawidia soli]MBT1687937.1 hypothetical protein [Dawidia soli]